MKPNEKVLTDAVKLGHLLSIEEHLQEADRCYSYDPLLAVGLRAYAKNLRQFVEQPQ